MMEFKDYYNVLQIPFNVLEKDIKPAYLAAAKRWHPDKNRNVDTTVMMQEIAEAYLILSDKEARRKYDLKYLAYYDIYNFSEKHTDTQSKANKQGSAKSSLFNYDDAELERWIKNAQKQSVQIAEELIYEIGNNFKIGLKGALMGMIKFKPW
jgi:curved DNA-binding protein CbpA